MDRLIVFYERVFDARLLLDMEEEGLRHAFIDLGSNVVLHPFQIPGVEVHQGPVLIFAERRLDHVSLTASSEEALRKFRGAWSRRAPMMEPLPIPVPSSD